LRGSGIGLKLRKRRLRSLQIARLQRGTNRLEILRQRAVLIERGTGGGILRERAVCLLRAGEIARLD